MAQGASCEIDPDALADPYCILLPGELFRRVAVSIPGLRESVAQGVDAIIRRLRFTTGDKAASFEIGVNTFRKRCGRHQADKVLTLLADDGVIHLRKNHSAGRHTRQYTWHLALSGVPDVVQLSGRWARKRQEDAFRERLKRRSSLVDLSPQAYVQVAFLAGKGSVGVDSILANAAALGLDSHPQSVCQWRVLQQLLTGNWCAKQKDRERLYTPVTWLSSPLRRTLTLQGNPVAQVDIANANPLILSALARKHIGNAAGSFVLACEKGELYSILAADAGVGRHTAKRDVQRFLNSHNPRQIQHADALPVSQSFQRLYPDVAGFIDGLRRSGKGATFGLCSRQEAEIVLPLVADLIDAGTPALSIHDAVMATEKDAERVAGRLARRIRSILGTACTLKVTLPNGTEHTWQPR